MTTHDPETDEFAQVTIVEAPGCHFCADAQEVLTEFAARYPLILTTIDVRTDLGMSLVREHRAAMNPLVLLDGEFFSNGRLPRKKLAKHLQLRFGALAASGTR